MDGRLTRVTKFSDFSIGTYDGPLFIGASYYGGKLGNYFTGQIDDVRIYDRLLTPRGDPQPLQGRQENKNLPAERHAEVGQPLQECGHDATDGVSGIARTGFHDRLRCDRLGEIFRCRLGTRYVVRQRSPGRRKRHARRSCDRTGLHAPVGQAPGEGYPSCGRDRLGSGGQSKQSPAMDLRRGHSRCCGGHVRQGNLPSERRAILPGGYLLWIRVRFAGRSWVISLRLPRPVSITNWRVRGSVRTTWTCS